MLKPKHNSVYEVNSQSQRKNKRCVGNQVAVVALPTELFFNWKSTSTLKSLCLGPGRIGRRALDILLGSSKYSVSYTIRANKMGWEKIPLVSLTTQEKIKPSR